MIGHRPYSTKPPAVPNHSSAAKPTITPPTSSPVAPLVPVPAPDELDELALLLVLLLELPLLLDVVFDAPAFWIATPPTPVAFLHWSPESNVAFFEKTISAQLYKLAPECEI